MSDDVNNNDRDVDTDVDTSKGMSEDEDVDMENVDRGQDDFPATREHRRLQKKASRERVKAVRGRNRRNTNNSNTHSTLRVFFFFRMTFGRVSRPICIAQ